MGWSVCRSQSLWPRASCQQPNTVTQQDKGTYRSAQTWLRNWGIDDDDFIYHKVEGSQGSRAYLAEPSCLEIHDYVYHLLSCFDWFNWLQSLLNPLTKEHLSTGPCGQLLWVPGYDDSAHQKFVNATTQKRTVMKNGNDCQELFQEPL